MKMKNSQKWIILLCTLALPRIQTVIGLDLFNQSRQSKADTELQTLQPIKYFDESTTEEIYSTQVSKETSRRSGITDKHFESIFLPTHPNFSSLDYYDTSSDELPEHYSHVHTPERAVFDQLDGEVISENEDYEETTVRSFEDWRVLEEESHNRSHSHQVQDIEKSLEALSEETEVYPHHGFIDDSSKYPSNDDIDDYQVEDEMGLDERKFSVDILRQKPDSPHTSKERKGMRSGESMNIAVLSRFYLQLLSLTVYLLRLPRFGS